jgi:DNA-binding transcriptional regulator YhcF (GntR family)
MMTLTGCTEFAMLSSAGGLAVSHNTYAKVYSGLDFLTIINTDKDIKTHVFNNMKEDK